MIRVPPLPGGSGRPACLCSKNRRRGRWRDRLAARGENTRPSWHSASWNLSLHNSRLWWPAHTQWAVDVLTTRSSYTEPHTFFIPPPSSLFRLLSFCHNDQKLFVNTEIQVHLRVDFKIKVVDHSLWAEFVKKMIKNLLETQTTIFASHIYQSTNPVSKPALWTQVMSYSNRKIATIQHSRHWRTSSGAAKQTEETVYIIRNACACRVETPACHDIAIPGGKLNHFFFFFSKAARSWASVRKHQRHTKKQARI